MAKFEDITGQRYGRLVALSYVGQAHCKSKKKYQTKSIWLFSCDCGNVVERKVGHVKKGDTRSCGCLKEERIQRMGKENSLPTGESSFNGLFHNYQNAAKARGIPWDLPKDEFRRITQLPCLYCGALPTAKFRSHRSSNGHYSYSGVDRVDNTKGYTIGNSVPCCKTCNSAKGTLPVMEFLEWMKRIKKTVNEIYSV